MVDLGFTARGYALLIPIITVYTGPCDGVDLGVRCNELGTSVNLEIHKLR